jgi:hypothetical protein
MLPSLDCHLHLAFCLYSRLLAVKLAIVSNNGTMELCVRATGAPARAEYNWSGGTSHGLQCRSRALPESPKRLYVNGGSKAADFDAIFPILQDATENKWSATFGFWSPDWLKGNVLRPMFIESPDVSAYSSKQ